MGNIDRWLMGSMPLDYRERNEELFEKRNISINRADDRTDVCKYASRDEI